MRKIFFLLIIVFACTGVWAEDKTNTNTKFNAEASAIENSTENPIVETKVDGESIDESSVKIDPVTGFPVIENIPFIVFNEGLSSNFVTRIAKQTQRSNFVFQDNMVGAYCSLLTYNMQPCDSTIRIAAYYPLSFSFNNVPQVAKNPIRYAIDIFAAPVIKFNMWQYVRYSFAPGLHFMFQNSDRWNYINLGLGGNLGLELPLARHWTIVANLIASIDYGNFGTNGSMEPYDFVWQYQFEIGFRYSKKAENTYNYLKQ